ncbi:hypothetical protein ACFYKX_04680 [Cytobacillus sp. FJAT-54145]|uniref:DUF4878 domain-containing protein n=1 Tax=Cytobacillus spartinae TaxID=3299023 RepID=A0ABW6KAF0_9BACI
MKNFTILAITCLLLIITGCSSLEKQEEIIIKEVSYDELYWIEREQRDLIYKLNEDKERESIIEEVQKGVNRLRFKLDFMHDHPEYNIVKIEFLAVKYTNGDHSFEFMSDRSVITEVHSEIEGWKDY